VGEAVSLGRPAAQRLFETYDSARYKEFDEIAATFRGAVINPFDFEVEADAWMAAADRRRRALVAAAVAVELAAVSFRREALDARDVERIAMWRAANQVGIVLAELGCAWLREDVPQAVEQSWHEAFVALAQAMGRAEDILPSSDWELRDLRLARLAGISGRRMSQLERTRVSDRQRREDREREAYRILVNQLERSARRLSSSTRIDAAAWHADHGRHLLMRFPDSPLPLFVKARAHELRTLSGAADTLLIENTWLDGNEIERIASGGARQVRAVPTNRRMDKASAERFLRMAPEPEESLCLSVTCAGRASAAYTSLILWDMVESFRAVPDQEPVAAERAIRLGQNYARLARPDLALPELIRAEALATTPYELHLARLFAGALLASTSREAAIGALRSALRAVPRAPSASFALAPLLLQVDARNEAAEVLEAAMKLPQADDPLLAYYQGDPTALSRALARLRDAVQR
jgi:hypothetical protein